MLAHAFAELHERMLDVTWMLVIVQILADLFVRELAAKPRAPPKQEGHQHDQPCGEEK